MEVGIDITSIKRFENRSDRFIKNILTEEEFSEYSNLSFKAGILYLAIRWACKEAIFKATQDLNYLKYVILNYEDGRPYVLGHPEIKISIGNDEDFVTAIVIVE